MTKHTSESLRETFILGLKAIFKIAGYRKTFFSSWVTILPIFISIFGYLILLLFKIDLYDTIGELKSLMLNFLPGILGFTIAGYSLMVGFIQAGMLDRISEPTQDSNFSLYQKMSSTFAVNIILQGAALIIAYTTHFITFIDEKKKTPTFLTDCQATFINSAGVIILTYWFFISLFMVIQIVMNIFSFSQLHHYFVNKQKVDEKDRLNK